MYWHRLIPAHRHPPAESYNLLLFTITSWKGATTPCSNLPASPGRELLPPALVYQLPLEGSYNPLVVEVNPLYGQRRSLLAQTGSSNNRSRYSAGS